MTRMKTTIRRALVLGVCGLAITSAHAQEPTANNTAQNEAEADDGAVGEIVVTARRRTEALSDVPVSITAFSFFLVINQPFYGWGILKEIKCNCTYHHREHNH